MPYPISPRPPLRNPSPTVCGNGWKDHPANRLSRRPPTRRTPFRAGFSYPWVAWIVITTTAKLDGVDFDVMHVAITAGPLTVQQKYYATIIKGYALILVVSFTNAEEESDLQRVLDGVSFQ